MQKSETSKKVLIAGSHGATTAISIVEEIKLSKKPWSIYFLGNKWATEDKKSYSFEFSTIPETGAKFLEVEPGKIENKFTTFTLAAFFKIPIEFLQVLLHVLRVWPDLVLSLGGAAGAITSFWAWLFGIPVIIHEPTATAGRANLLSKGFAKRIAISRSSSGKYYPANKTVLTGLPISRLVSKVTMNSISKRDKKIVLFTGGSRGSKWINDALYPVLPLLTSKYNIIHQVGVNEFSKFAELKYPNYKAVSQVSREEMVEFIRESDVVVGRAGANTVAELIALKKPAILIPIPWSYLNEQFENAKFMEESGAAKILTQDKLTSEELLRTLDELVTNYETFKVNAKKMNSPDIEAAKKILDLIQQVI